jgi:hypothetical protein
VKAFPLLAATLAAAALAMPALAQTTGCEKPAYIFCDGCAFQVPVRAKPGATCVFNIQPGNGVLLGVSIVVRPKQGQWGSAGPSRFAYQVRPNASGADYFEVEIKYESNGRRTSTRLQAQVAISR